MVSYYFSYYGKIALRLNIIVWKNRRKDNEKNVIRNKGESIIIK